MRKYKIIINCNLTDSVLKNVEVEFDDFDQLDRIITAIKDIETSINCIKII